MKLKNLVKLYKISKNWNFDIEDKLVIPEYDLEKLDIKRDVQDPNPQGAYMPPMTEEDYIKWQQQKSGWQKFYDKVKDNVNKI